MLNVHIFVYIDTHIYMWHIWSIKVSLAWFPFNFDCKYFLNQELTKLCKSATVKMQIKNESHSCF